MNSRETSLFSPLAIPTVTEEKKAASAHFIVDAFDFVEQGLGAQHFGVVLLEVNALMVQRLEVILLILLPPDLIKTSLGFPPLLLLGL